MTTDLLVFTLGLQQFALPVEQVAGVVPRATLTRLPGAPPELIGLLRLRGALCPVVDIRTRLALPASPPDVGERIVLMRTSAAIIGLLAEGVLGVVRKTTSDRVDRVSVASNLIRRVAEVSGHVVATLDAEAIVSDAVRAYLAATAEDMHYLSGSRAA